MRMILIAIAAGATTACGSPSVVGDYGGDSCIYENIVLQGDGVAVVTWLGKELPLQYRLEEDKIIITKMDGSPKAFMLKGNDLVPVQEPMRVCTRK